MRLHTLIVMLSAVACGCFSSDPHDRCTTPSDAPFSCSRSIRGLNATELEQLCEWKATRAGWPDHVAVICFEDGGDESTIISEIQGTHRCALGLTEQASSEGCNMKASLVYDCTESRERVSCFEQLRTPECVIPPECGGGAVIP